MLRIRVLPVILLPAILLSGLTLWYRHHYNKKKKEYEALRADRPSYIVLFFPDDATARSLSATTKNTRNEDHEGNLSVLMFTFQRATRSIDACIFAFSCKEIGDILIDAHRGGIVVRVIADNEQISSSGSQVERLRRAGIQVRHNFTSYLMHHKFAIIDQTFLINGSLNWTLQGVCGNQENVVITDTPEMVVPFMTQFENIWDYYDPEKNVY